MSRRTLHKKSLSFRPVRPNRNTFAGRQTGWGKRTANCKGAMGGLGKLAEEMRTQNSKRRDQRSASGRDHLLCKDARRRQKIQYHERTKARLFEPVGLLRP